ncbi:MAG: 4Fe-4S binding protein [Syntrophaceae bacterium]|nr:4Fe-4S binding protein [Syntrophaceae bacterium]
MNNQDDVYRKLQREINKMPIAFPETDTGIEIKLLKHLFSPAEAEIALNLNMLPETLSRIYERVKKSGIKITAKELEETLDNLVKKGAILGAGLFESKRKGKQYSLSMLAIGMMENQVDRLSREYAEDFLQYFKDTYHKNFYGVKTAQMRTIPINKSITPKLRVEPYNDIKAYISNLNDDIAVLNCICRQMADVTDNKCRHSELREVCFAFRDCARFVLSKGVGRSLTKQEALAILDRVEEAGFILQPENAREPQFLCCCCSDCCHVLRGLKMFAKPSEHFHASYYAVVDESLCKGCKKCVKKCGMEAISIQNKVAVINLDCCLGCGVCITVCVNNAITLKKKVKKHLPPRTHETLYQKVMLERFGIVNALKTVLKILVGRKA